jgi:hypothetical protein
MPSVLHQTLVSLFRDCPMLAPELIAQTSTDVELPVFDDIEASDADAVPLILPDYRADLVLVLRLDEEPVLALVVEAQLACDPGKRRSWPIYEAVLAARWRCKAGILVVTGGSQVGPAHHRARPQVQVRPHRTGARRDPANR